MRFNTAFNPPKDVIEQTISLSGLIGKNNDAFFMLDGINFYPHITIYSPEYPESNLNKILETVKEITNRTKKITFVSKGLATIKGFIGVYFELTPEIKQLHEEIITRLNPLREERIREKWQKSSDYHMEFSQEQKENIEKYGYPDAMNLYKPHLSIIRLKDECLAETIVSKLNWGISQFVVDEIGVYKMGEHGACRELVREFSLK